MAKKNELDMLNERNPLAAEHLQSHPNIIGVAGVGKNPTRLMVVGGDNRVLGFGWPAWYEVVHIDKNDSKRRIQDILGSGKIHHVFVLMRWRDERLISLVRKFAQCPVHYWPQGIGELVKNIGAEIKKYEEKKAAPKAEKPEPQPDRKPKAKVWFEPPKEQPSTTAAPAAPVIAEAPKEEAMPPKNTTTPPKKESVVTPKQKEDLYARLGNLASNDKRKTVWTREDLERLVCAWEECGDDAQTLFDNFMMLGGKRTATALLFCIQKIGASLGVVIHPKLLKGLRKLSEADRKKSTLGIVEMIEKDKGSNILKQQQEDDDEEEDAELLEQASSKVPQALAHDVRMAAAQRPLVMGPPYTPALEDIKPPLGIQRESSSVLVDKIRYIALGVRMAGKSKTQAFDEILALLGMA